LSCMVVSFPDAGNISQDISFPSTLLFLRNCEALDV
jgi:hypothetical protein